MQTFQDLPRLWEDFGGSPAAEVDEAHPRALEAKRSMGTAAIESQPAIFDAVGAARQHLADFEVRIAAQRSGEAQSHALLLWHVRVVDPELTAAELT